MGLNTKAIGEISFALGVNSIARGNTTFAMGLNARAIGHGSIAIGANTLAYENASIAMGSSTKAYGYISFAMGYQSIAGGTYSTAMGANTKAGGESAMASGYFTTAGGKYSTSSGFFTNARSYGSAVLGRFNDSLALSNNTTWVNYDPLWIIGNGTSIASPHNAMVVYKNGNMILKNPNAHYYNKLQNPYPIPVSGEGTRMMWLPELSVFRVGTVSDTAWDASNLGPGSFSTGLNGIASGMYSLAAGEGTKASGAVSMAIGVGNIAKGYSSLALGMYNDPILTVDQINDEPTTPLFIIGNGNDAGTRHNAVVVYKNGNLLLKNPTTITTDPGVLSVPISGLGTRMMWLPEKSAFRVGTATGTGWDSGYIGTWSFASGKGTTASGIFSTAFGSSTVASGEGSTAFGVGGIASGDYSFANGSYTKAIATHSSATGINTRARGYGSNVSGWYNIAKGFCSTVVGAYNDSLLLTNQNTSTFETPLFVVGNGDSPSFVSNAMVVYKSGIVALKNRLLVSADPGDIIFPASISGAGTRMMWIPEKSAFRAGSIQGTHWDGDKIGAWSFASGWNVTARGIKSTAMGSGTSASGESSTALGGSTQAEGTFSLSTGLATISNSYAQTTIGRYNDTLNLTNPNPTVWEPNDALFVAGNGSGTGFIPRHNAFVIYKNGDTDIDGNTEIDGFTKLGDSTSTSNVPSIKMKKLTGTSAATQNAWTNVAHELTMSKILSVNIIMTVPGFVNLPPSYTYQAGYEYQYQIATSNIVVINSAANSSNILTKAFTILITYEQ